MVHPGFLGVRMGGSATGPSIMQAFPPSGGKPAQQGVARSFGGSHVAEGTTQTPRFRRNSPPENPDEPYLLKCDVIFANSTGVSYSPHSKPSKP